MFCTNCAQEIDAGELICKGCGRLSTDIQDELLAMSEKSTDLKCSNCGSALGAEHHYCKKCGTQVSR